MIKTIAFLLSLIFASSACAENLYVCASGGGSTDGSSWDSCFNGFTDISWGASAGQVGAGDTLYIDGGVESQTYANTILSIGASGEAGSPITIRVGQDAGHDGNAILDFDACGNSCTKYSGIEFYGKSYITIDGSVNDNRKLTVKNLRNTSNRIYGRAISDRTSSGSSSSNITVKHTIAENCNSGITMSGGTGYDVNNNYMTVIRGDVGISVVGTGEWGANLIHHNYISRVVNETTKYGPDGISNKHGTSIYNNTFQIDSVEYYVSDQHPDSIQSTGNYVKVFNNDFINIGDSGFDSDSGYDATYRAPHDIWIYNNTFRIVNYLDQFPEYIRFYNCTETVSNLKIFNNDFIDNNEFANIKIACGDSTTGSGNEIKNNIWHNSIGSYVSISFAGAALGSSFSFDYNVYSGTSSITYLGSTTSATDWIAAHEPHSRTSPPTFASYSANDINNNLRLSSSDTATIRLGTGLSAFFTTDKEGKTRTLPWDIGPYEFSTSRRHYNIITSTGQVFGPAD